MFYLEVVCSDGNEENSHSHLLADYDTVKDVLNGATWLRFVITELNVQK